MVVARLCPQLGRLLLAPLELVGCYIVWGIVIKIYFSNQCHTETKTINFMVSMDMIVTSMDFKY
jgi:hypothetical protein